jgi:hypothetical protein
MEMREKAEERREKVIFAHCLSPVDELFSAIDLDKRGGLIGSRDER